MKKFFRQINKRKLAILSMYIIILVTIGFIWGNSFASPFESGEQSMAAAHIVRPFLELFIGRGQVTDHFVRKLAHFTEYGILGLELMLLLIVRKRHGIQPIINCLFAGLSAALVDETIQIFTARGPQVQDVWLDFSGVCAGSVFILALYYISKFIRGRLARNKIR